MLIWGGLQFTVTEDSLPFLDHKQTSFHDARNGGNMWETVEFLSCNNPLALNRKWFWHCRKRGFACLCRPFFYFSSATEHRRSFQLKSICTARYQRVTVTVHSVHSSVDRFDRRPRLPVWLRPATQPKAPTAVCDWLLRVKATDFY